MRTRRCFPFSFFFLGRKNESAALIATFIPFGRVSSWEWVSGEFWWQHPPRKKSQEVVENSIAPANKSLRGHCVVLEDE